MWYSLYLHALLTLIHALVVSKVDCCNFVLAGIRGHLMDRLQHIPNAAAQLAKEVREHYTTSYRVPLAESSEANTILVHCCLHRTSTILSRLELPPDHRCHCLLPSTVCSLLIIAACSSCSTIIPRIPLISSGCIDRIAQSAQSNQNYTLWEFRTLLLWSLFP